MVIVMLILKFLIVHTKIFSQNDSGDSNDNDIQSLVTLSGSNYKTPSDVEQYAPVVEQKPLQHTSGNFHNVI